MNTVVGDEVRRTPTSSDDEQLLQSLLGLAAATEDLVEGLRLNPRYLAELIETAGLDRFRWVTCAQCGERALQPPPTGDDDDHPQLTCPNGHEPRMMTASAASFERAGAELAAALLNRWLDQSALQSMVGSRISTMFPSENLDLGAVVASVRAAITDSWPTAALADLAPHPGSSTPDPSPRLRRAIDEAVRNQLRLERRARASSDGTTTNA